MTTVIEPLIDGKTITTKEYFETHDPADASVIAHIGTCGREEVDNAVAAARRATEPWSSLSAQERGVLLQNLAKLILRDQESLARLESRDVGKPLSQARNDVLVAARYFEFYAGVISALHGETLPTPSGIFGYTLRVPHGVTGHITPWNYPLQISARTLAPALAAGNCVVHKPAEGTPLTAVEVAGLAMQAGFPAGVFNVITGDGAVGAMLASHPGIDHISFTGSVETGRKVGHAAAETLIPSTLELGGKSPNIVFSDADLDAAIPSIVNSIIQNAGQTCVAGSRLLVHRDVHAQVVSAVADRFSRLKLGRGLDDPDLGPLVSKQQQARVKRYVSQGRAEADLVFGGSIPVGEGLGGGWFFEPTLFDNVPGDSVIGQEEIFGPVLTVTPFTDEAEAIRIANGTDYGLIAAVWTADVDRAHAMVRALHAGQVFVNNYGAGGGIELPFGGVKRSGYGREKGFEALLGYTYTKTVAVRVPKANW